MLALFVLLYQLHFSEFLVHSLPVAVDIKSSDPPVVCKFYYIPIKFVVPQIPLQIFTRSGSNISLSCPLDKLLPNQSTVLWSGPSFKHVLNSTDTIQFENIAISYDFLDIFNVSKHYEGNYSCQQDGKTLASWTLFVLGISNFRFNHFSSDMPAPPSSLVPSPYNQSAIFLQWTNNNRQVPKSLIYEFQVTG